MNMHEEYVKSYKIHTCYKKCNPAIKSVSVYHIWYKNCCSQYTSAIVQPIFKIQLSSAIVIKRKEKEKTW